MKNVMIVVCLLGALISCTGEKKLIKVQGETMGTYYKVVTYGTESSKDLKEDIDKFLRLFNDVFSTYIPSSEISKINKSELESFMVTDSMNKILELSLDISTKSNGYFDITVGPLVNAWGFGPDGKRKIPTNDEIKELLKSIGYSKLKHKDGRLDRPKGMYLDLSAIAKGFGVDELVKFLEFKGHGNLLVEIGGEVRTRGKKQDGSLWKVGIEGPSEKLGKKLSKVLQLDNLSMATSGSYRNYKKYGDDIFHHTIDPKTGKPANHQTISVSIVSEYCADADAWATALMSMGVEKGIELANKMDLLAYFQYKEGSEVKVISSNKFQKKFGN